MSDTNFVTMKAFNALLTTVQQMQDQLNTVQVPGGGPGQFQITLPDGSTSTDPYDIPGFADMANQMASQAAQMEAINSQMPAIPQLQLLQLLMSGGTGDINQATALTTSQQLGDDTSQGLGGVPQIAQAAAAAGVYKPPATEILSLYISNQAYTTGGGGAYATVNTFSSITFLIGGISPALAAAWDGTTFTVPATGLYRISYYVRASFTPLVLNSVSATLMINGVANYYATGWGDSSGGGAVAQRANTVPGLMNSVILSLPTGTTVNLQVGAFPSAGSVGVIFNGTFSIERIYVN